MSMETVAQILVVVGILSLAAGGMALFVRWDTKRFEGRRRVFKQKLRTIRDRAKEDMRLAKSSAELDAIATRVQDEIEDCEL